MNHSAGNFPLHIDAELNTSCNLQCPECPNHSVNARYPPLENTEMEWSLYEKIINEGSRKGLCAITLCFRGEPLVYRMLPEAIIYAKQRKIMDVRLNSNGILLDKEKAVQLITSGLDLLIISDYGIEQQYKNVRLLQDYKLAFDTDKPKVRVKTNNIRKWDGIADEIAQLIWYDYNSGVEVNKESEFECPELWQRLTVLANGDVKFCCSSVLFSDSILGNLEFYTLEQLWNSEQLNHIRFLHQNHRTNLIKSCRYCPGLIEYLKKKGE